MGKQFSIFIALLTTICACTKQTFPDPVDQNISMAKAILKERMASNDFASLDWNKSVVKKINVERVLVTIPSKEDPKKTLYFSITDKTPVYNWVKLENDSPKSGTFSIIDIDNRVLNKFAYTDNDIIRLPPANPGARTANNTGGMKHRILSEGGFFGGDESLPPVTVYAYINSSYYQYSSLYWLFNMNESFLPYFESGVGDMPILDANNYNAGAYTTYATKDILSDGTVQITNTNPHAFLVCGLKLIFTYAPNTNALNSSSVAATTTGLFLGSWTGPTVSNIVSTSTTISFVFSYTNSYTLSGILPFNKVYRMGIVYDLTTNLITWDWLP